jgi:hypothetical protein
MRSVTAILALAAVAGAQNSAVVLGQVRAELEGVRDQLAAAYEELLVIDPDASGTIMLEFEIIPAGFVSSVSVTCDPGLETVADVVDGAARRMSFAPGMVDELTEISVPFELLPGEDG